MWSPIWEGELSKDVECVVERGESGAVRVRRAKSETVFDPLDIRGDAWAKVVGDLAAQFAELTAQFRAMEKERDLWMGKAQAHLHLGIGAADAERAAANAGLCSIGVDPNDIKES